MYKITVSAFFIFIAVTSCKTQSDFQMNSEKIRKIISLHSDSVSASENFPDKDVRKYLHKEFQEFYKERGYELAWLDFDQPLASSEELLKAIDLADKEGLEPENYNLTKIEKLLKEIYKVESKRTKRKHRRATRSLNKTKREQAREKDTLRLHDIVKLDFLITSTYLTYASHLLSGKINPDEGEHWFSKPRKKDLSKHLAEALTNKKVFRSLQDLAPKHTQYGLLKKELERIRVLNQDDTFPKLLTNKTFKMNSEDRSIISIKHKLFLLGDLAKNDSLTIFNKDLFAAVKRFQRRNSLEETGMVDQKTVSILNWPHEKRIDQLKINMERMRWFPDEFGPQYLLVNIPEYRMRVYEKGKKAVEMKVIVGTTYNPTPIFSDSMEYIVLNPTWTVPRSIAKKEFLPKVKENPDFFKENGYTVYQSWKANADTLNYDTVKWEEIDTTTFNYKIVERPGEKNSLGLIKFIFPNNLDIYLHDTPGNHLFNVKDRSFSHGCVRVEKPFDLAAYLLKDKGWDLEKIKTHIKNNKGSEIVNLPEKMPVHIVYWTAWVDDNNILNFAEDVYKHDKEQEKAIKKKEALF